MTRESYAMPGREVLPVAWTADRGTRGVPGGRRKRLARCSADPACPWRWRCAPDRPCPLHAYEDDRDSLESRARLADIMVGRPD
jgi:hypothetical protein